MKRNVCERNLRAGYGIASTAMSDGYKRHGPHLRYANWLERINYRGLRRLQVRGNDNGDNEFSLVQSCWTTRTCS